MEHAQPAPIGLRRGEPLAADAAGQQAVQACAGGVALAGAQRIFVHAVNHSPRVAAQNLQLRALFGPGVRREAGISTVVSVAGPALQRYVQVNTATSVAVNSVPGQQGPPPQEFHAQQPPATGQLGQVLVVGSPQQLRVSEDGRMAIEDSDLTARQPKVFYADPAVWQASNAQLTQSRYELYCDRANAITVTLGGQGHDLDRVLARVGQPLGQARTAREEDVTLEVGSDCITVATAVIGRPPPPEVERELVVAHGRGASRSLGEYHAAVAMCEWARARDWRSWGWPSTWWELLTRGPAARATRLALLEFQAALNGTDALQAVARQYALLLRDRRELAMQAASALGVNVHAQPGVGEAYETLQLGVPSNALGGAVPDYESDSSGATAATLTSPTQGGQGITRHAWGQHIGAVVAVSAGNRVTLENYARRHEQGSLRAGPDYYFQMYGPPHLPQQTWHHAWTAGARAVGLPPVINAVTVVVRR